MRKDLRTPPPSYSTPVDLLSDTFSYEIKAYGVAPQAVFFFYFSLYPKFSPFGRFFARKIFALRAIFAPKKFRPSGDFLLQFNRLNTVLKGFWGTESPPQAKILSIFTSRMLDFLWGNAFQKCKVPRKS